MTTPPPPPPSQPPYYANAPYGAPPSYPRTWMNVVSLVSALLWFAVIAIVFGHLGVRASNRGEAQYKGLAIAGLVIGYLGLVMQAFWLVILIMSAADPL